MSRLTGNGESDLKVSCVHKGLGTGLTLSLHSVFFSFFSPFPFISLLFKCHWQVLSWWIACSKGPKLFSGRRTKATMMCANLTPLSGMWGHLSCSPAALTCELNSHGANRATCLMPLCTSCDWCGSLGWYRGWNEFLCARMCQLWADHHSTPMLLSHSGQFTTTPRNSCNSELLIWIPILHLTFMWTLKNKLCFGKDNKWKVGWEGIE